MLVRVEDEEDFLISYNGVQKTLQKQQLKKITGQSNGSVVYAED